MNILKMNLILAGFLLVLPFGRLQAQCQPDFPGQILQACGNADLLQLESDTVTSYLQLHHLPPSASNIIYQYGRADLRDAIRALMFDNMLGIISADPSTLTPHQQNLLNWFNGLVQSQLTSLWNTEVADINAWENNPCAWSPDPQVASAAGLTYDPGEYCSGNALVTAFSPGPPVPSPGYFQDVALKNTFEAPVTGSPSAIATQEDLQVKSYLAMGYAATPAVGLSAAAAAATYQYFLDVPSEGVITTLMQLNRGMQASIQAIANADGLEFGEAADAASELQEAATELSLAAITDSAADFAAGPGAIVLVAVEIGVSAGFDFFDYNDAVNQLNAIKNNPPNQSLSDLATDSTGVGMLELQTTFTAQTLPDTPSTQTLPQHRAGVDPYFVLQPPPAPGTTTETQTESQTLTYTDLAGTQWSIQTYEGFFLQTGTQTNGTVVNTISPALTITDPQGTTWDVEWDGTTFLLTKTQPASTDTVCRADPSTGVSDGVNFETCSSYVAYTFTLQDGTIVSIGQEPVFTSDPIAGEPAGQPFSLNITAVGIPAPNVGPAGGLPAGFSASGGNNGSLTLSGSAPEGTYTIPLAANNGSGTATQNLTLILGTAPQIVSPAQFTFTRGFPATFTIHAAGNPVPSISLGSNFTLPPGFTFHDNGNGTATISGNQSLSCFINVGPYTFSCGPIVYGGTVIAQSPINQVQQNLTINSNPAPDPTVVPFTNPTFTPGINNTFTITTTGAITPVTITLDPNTTSNVITGPATLPSWLHFQDNGNGTATLSGNPPLTAAPYDLSYVIDAEAAGGPNVVLLPPTITINVGAAPAFTDTGLQLMRKCQVNHPPNECLLDVDTNMLTGTLSLSGNVPAGLFLGISIPQGQLQFETATGGAYPVTVNATNSYGSANQIYTFYMRQAPGFPTAISGDNLDIWLMAKVPANYSIPTTGYPHDIGVTLPDGTQYLPPMQLSLESVNGFAETLPVGLTFASQTSAGIPTGTALISGTPTQVYPNDPLTLKANNGLTSYLNITLHVRAPGDVNNDGEVNCTDVDVIKAALGSYVGQPNYNVQADINNDGAVNVKDLALAAPYLPKGCQ